MFKFLKIFEQIKKWPSLLVTKVKRIFKDQSAEAKKIASSHTLNWNELLQEVDISHRVQAHHELHRMLQEDASDEELAQYGLGVYFQPMNYCAQEERDNGQKL